MRELIRTVGTRLRSGPGGPRLTGAQALAVIGAAFLTTPEHWCEAVERLLDDVGRLPALPGTRVFLTGCDHDHPDAYEAIESLGCVIVGEDHSWGALAGEASVGPAYDIRSALVRAGALQAPAAAGHSAAVRAAQTARMAAACGADLVVAWARCHDDAPPWDVPAQREALQAVGIPMFAVPAQRYGEERNENVRSLLEPALRRPARAAGVTR